jgi:hypothetical protein
MLDTKAWLGFEAVVIATTDFGDSVHVRPGPAEPDAVYVTHHDGGDTEVFAASVAELVQAFRQTDRRR